MLKYNHAQQPLSHFWWIIPIILFLLMAYFTPELDLAISNYYYDQDLQAFPGNHLFDAIRFWAIIPAMFIAVAAAMFIGFSFLFSFRKEWLPYAQMLVLPMILGAGIITHTLLKDHWGRPRPKQIEHFGGESNFRPFYQPNLTLEVQQFKSFPCGHCSMGFYFFAVALLGRRLGSKRLFALGLSLALMLGVSLSMARIAQGGHFFSDTVATALIMWITALACDWLLFSETFSKVNFKLSRL